MASERVYYDCHHEKERVRVLLGVTNGQNEESDLSKDKEPTKSSDAWLPLCRNSWFLLQDQTNKEQSNEVLGPMKNSFSRERTC